MKPTNFSQANIILGPPKGLDESHIASIPAFLGEFGPGPFDGEKYVIVAWQPNEMDIERIKAGAPVFISMIGGLAPHSLRTDFNHFQNPD